MVTGARLGTPAWRWGALLRGQEPSWHRAGRCRLQLRPVCPPGSSQCCSEVGRCSSGAGGMAGGTWAWLQVFIWRYQMARWHLAIPRSHRKSIGKEGWIFWEISVSPPPVTPLQSCTPSRGAAWSSGAPGFAFRQKHAWIYVRVQHKPIRRAGRGQDKSWGTCVAAAWGGGCQSPAGRPDPTCAGRAGRSHPSCWGVGT